MHLVRRSLVFLMLVLLVPAAAAQERDRLDWGKWYAGVGLGLGTNVHYKQGGRALDFDDGVLQGATDKSALGALNVEGGVRLNANALVGVNVTSVAKSGKVNGADAVGQIGNYFLTITYFPRQEGFFLRAGGGYAAMVLNDGSTKTHTGGFGIQGGLGYAFHIVSNHYLTLAADQSFQWYSSGDNTKPTRSNFGAVYVSYMYRH